MTPLQLVAYRAYVDACMTIGWVPLPEAEWLNTPASAEYVEYSFKCVSVKQEPLSFPKWALARQEYEAYLYRCEDQRVSSSNFKDWLFAKEMQEGDLRAEYNDYLKGTKSNPLELVTPYRYEEWLAEFKGKAEGTDELRLEYDQFIASCRAHDATAAIISFEQWLAVKKLVSLRNSNTATPKGIAEAASAGPMLFDRSLIDSIPVTVTTTGNSAWVNKLECLARLTFNRGARKGGAYVAEVFPKDNGDLRNPPKHCVTQDLEFAVRFVVEELDGIHDLKLTESQTNTLRSVDPDAASFAVASEVEGDASITEKAAKWDKLAGALKMQRLVIYGQVPVAGEFDEAVNAELRERCVQDIQALERLLESLGF